MRTSFKQHVYFLMYHAIIVHLFIVTVAQNFIKLIAFIDYQNTV